MKPAVFELATSNDQEELLIMIDAFYAIDGYAFDKIMMEKSVNLFLQDKSLGNLYLVKTADETAGYICITLGYSFEYGGRIAVLDELFIKKSFRNTGLGKACLAFVDTYAKENGIKAIHMEVEEHNIVALGLYTSRGYSSKGRRLITKYIN